MKSKSIIIATVCIALTAGIFCYVKFGSSGNNDFMRGAKNAGNQTASVRTQKAVISTLHDYVITNGEIEAQTSVDVFPDRGGKIVSVNVSLGSYIKKGDIIAKIDPSEPGAVYAQSPVYAPISGTVTATPLKIGVKVSSSSVITTIGDVTNLQVTANVPERYVSLLKIGLKADIILESYPDQKFTATVTKVSPVVDKRSRTKEVIMNFDKNDSRINAGMFAKVTLWTVDYSGCITTTQDSIVTKNGDTYVYIIKEDNTAELRKVSTGNSVDNRIQITEGVNEGERIVVEGMRALSDGANVQDISNPEPALTKEGE